MCANLFGQVLVSSSGLGPGGESASSDSRPGQSILPSLRPGEATPTQEGKLFSSSALSTSDASCHAFCLVGQLGFGGYAQSAQGCPHLHFRVQASIVKVSATQSCPPLCDPMDLQVPLSMGFSRQGCQNGCYSLLRGIFPTQGSNPGLLCCRWIPYPLSHQGSPQAGASNLPVINWGFPGLPHSGSVIFQNGSQNQENSLFTNYQLIIKAYNSDVGQLMNS